MRQEAFFQVTSKSQQHGTKPFHSIPGKVDVVITILALKLVKNTSLNALKILGDQLNRGLMLTFLERHF